MKIYQPLTNTEKLFFRNAETEADLQSQLYAKLIKDKFSVRVGVPFKQTSTYSGCQFDLVIYKNKNAVAIIELKSASEGPQVDVDASHQFLKYREFGVPVILFWDMTDYDELKNFLKTGQEESASKNAPVIFKDPHILKRLSKSLDIAQMSAYDLGLHDLEKDIEGKRDQINQKLTEVLAGL